MNRALFLDRDGVINRDREYLHRQEDFEFIDGIFELCRHYQERGYRIVVVTNQSGIARGYYSEADFAGLTAWMCERFEEEGVTITAVYHCPHHPEITGPCRCRKPEPGMLLQAARDHRIDLNASVLIGDAPRDIEAALRAGVPKRYLFDPAGRAPAAEATKTIQSLKELLC